MDRFQSHSIFKLTHIKHCFSVRYIVILRLFFGFYSDVYTTRLTKLLGKIYVILLNLLTIGAHIHFNIIVKSTASKSLVISDTISIIENTYALFLSLTYKDKSFYEFCAKIIEFDGIQSFGIQRFKALNVKCSNSYVVLLVSILGKAICLYYGCITRMSLKCFDFIYIMDAIAAASYCVRYMTMFIMCELLRIRLKFTRIKFEKIIKVQGSAKCEIINETVAVHKYLIETFQRTIQTPYKTFVSTYLYIVFFKEFFDDCACHPMVRHH